MARDQADQIGPVNPAPLPQDIIPWYIRVNVGTRFGVGPSQTFSLISGYSYRHVTLPNDYPLEVIGFNAAFDPDGVLGQVAVIQQMDRWTPVQTPLITLFGQRTQADPLQRLAVPYLLLPTEQLVFDLINLSGGNIDNSYVTVVCRKYPNGYDCPPA